MIAKNFLGNPLIIEAGLQAETYGVLPSELLDAGHLPPMTEFTLNQNVRVATERHKKKARERAQKNDSAVSQHEEDELVERQDARAKTAESMEQADMNTPSVEAQTEQLGGADAPTDAVSETESGGST